ncbi:MAG TPA: hypothetical protein PKN50_05365 [Spirochaetota bacterium]|nr:hypothetical protein [Spirochaetota bacterium]HPV42450.1 hypothetical protein [Spirochaetota bacterium]
MNISVVEKLYLLLARKTVSRVALFATAILTVIMMRIDAGLAGFGGKGAFYLQVAFTRSSFTEVLSSWRSGGVDLLGIMIGVNAVNALSYSVLFASATAFFAEARRSAAGAPVRRSDLVLMPLPFAAAVFDWISNYLLHMIFSGGSLREGLVMAYSILSSIKWGFVTLSLIALLKSYFSFRKAMKRDVPKER